MPKLNSHIFGESNLCTLVVFIKSVEIRPSLIKILLVKIILFDAELLLFSVFYGLRTHNTFLTELTLH